VFWQNLTENQSYTTFIFDEGAISSDSNSVHDHIFKGNLSYEFLDGQRVYPTFSQGFRRGGVNAVPLTGVLAEPATLDLYKPDRVDNYEIGIKGRTSTGLRYSADVFNLIWKDPQIGAVTLNDFPVVVNAPRARSRGVEFELHTPLLVPNLDLGLQYALADAVLTRSFCFPVNGVRPGTSSHPRTKWPSGRSARCTCAGTTHHPVGRLLSARRFLITKQTTRLSAFRASRY
jgi:outer membrane receptor protein involved in Fe transport